MPVVFTEHSGFPPAPVAVSFDDERMWVGLDDGRTLGIPIDWYPRLLNASPDERSGVMLSPSGLHWEAIDEDVSVAGLLAGRRNQIRRRPDTA